jgi:hypothetical protein
LNEFRQALFQIYKLFVDGHSIFIRAQRSTWRSGPGLPWG